MKLCDFFSGEGAPCVFIWLHYALLVIREKGSQHSIDSERFHCMFYHPLPSGHTVSDSLSTRRADTRNVVVLGELN